MPGTSRLVTASVVGVLITLGCGGRQRSPRTEHPSRAPARPWSCSFGVVTDDNGAPVAGAMVSAIGAITIFAVTDDSGRFEMTAPGPGAYLVRAHRNGFVASRTQTIEIRPGSRTTRRSPWVRPTRRFSPPASA